MGDPGKGKKKASSLQRVKGLILDNSRGWDSHGFTCYGRHNPRVHISPGLYEQQHG